MKDFEAERVRIRQSHAPEPVAEAAADPGGSVTSIESGTSGTPAVSAPGEAIQGVWLVDTNWPAGPGCRELTASDVCGRRIAFTGTATVTALGRRTGRRCAQGISWAGELVA